LNELPSTPNTQVVADANRVGSAVDEQGINAQTTENLDFGAATSEQAKIAAAFLRVEKDGKGWKVAAISVDKAIGNWFLFDDEQCNPDLHAFLISNKKLRGLKVKVYRNFAIDPLYLPAYLNSDFTKFEFSGKQLKPDVEKSIIDKGILLQNN
jgi:hypothetical protein